MHHLFEAQAKKAPEAIAVVFQGQALSYGELNQRANQLAHHLQKLGVGPEVLVGLYLDRSLDMVVATLAVFKAGGAYVPLDPAFPTDRLAFMVADAGLPLLLTQQPFLGELPPHQAQIFCIDRDWPQVTTYPQNAPASTVQPQHVAYIIYTSGSTGKPKGVQIPHQALCNFLWSMAQAPGLNADDTLLAVTTLSFDIAALELYLPLVQGAKIIMADRLTATDGEALLALLHQNRVSVMQGTPANWRLLLDAGWTNTPWLKALCGGEALPRQLAQQILARAGSLWNMYGPTETTVWSTIYPVTEIGERLPIGRPIANTQIHILDADLHPVPVGETGDLYIGGDGLARGYFKRPELTAEKFITHPEWGVRLYKTGDLARYLPDGNLEFFGRADFQIKIRGYRIETGDIETTLEQHPQIKQAVATVYEDETGDKHLAAYFMLTTPDPLDGPAIRAYLQQKLPEYMIPTFFVNLAEFPLTPNGKVDRNALPAPNAAALMRSQEFSPPQGPVETLLAEIWKAVLRLDQIGRTANFFTLGGHSLLAAQIIARLRHHFQQQISTQALFQYPTIASIAAYLNETRASTAAILPLKPRPATSTNLLPLSPAQKRLWFLQNLEPDNHFYHVMDTIRLHGPFDVQAMEQSLNQMIARHEVLRTSFAVIDGEPVQIVQPSLKLPLPVINLTDLNAATQKTEAEKYILQAVKTPFNLNSGPLLRATVLRLNKTEHILILCLHHIVTDDWSLHILYRELNHWYTHFSAGAIPALPPLSLQYADFALWQQDWLESAEYGGHLAYWQKQLAGMAPLFELPTDHPRPARQSYRGGMEPFGLDPALSQALIQLSQQENITLFMTLLAAFKVLLYRYSQLDEVVVGTPSANRDQVELEPLLGFFVNTLVLRTAVLPQLGFKDFLQSVRQTMLEAQAHRDVPFEKLVEVLQPERNLSYTPLFQVMFVYQNEPTQLPRLANLQVEPIGPLDVGSTQFDLILSLTKDGDALYGDFTYNTDLFEAESIRRMVGHLQTLLQDISHTPHKTIAELTLLTPAEQEQILHSWNNTRMPFADTLALHQLFEQQVQHRPQASAVEFGEQTLSYAQLNQRANQLAHYLRELGVGPEVLVGLCADRSPEMIVGMLGVLKAGGAYVPLDPAYPAERLAFILQDTQTPVLLTQQHLAADLPAQGQRTICLDSDWPTIARHPADTPPYRGQVSDLAYIIYTSGSTGQPKGVMIEHRAIVNYIQNVNHIYGLLPSDRLLQFSSISFDASVEEIFLPLVHGATLVIRPEDILSSNEIFWRYCETQKISVLEFPTAYWHQLVSDLAELKHLFPASVQTVIFGGEAVMTEAVNTWLEHAPAHVRLINGYGPTETTIAVTFYELKTKINLPNVPIGPPMGNIQAYILDKNLQPVPVNVPGELHFGGVGLARGYLNRPGLTAEKFIQHPTIKQRLYKTGDLARYLPDGNIEFLGRVDNQIKLRGFRIELGEIEAALQEYPAINQAIVLLHQTTPDSKHLVAYFTTNTPTSVDSAPLREFLQNKLPHYMVPAVFLQLGSFPLTPNGKLNRNALPSPDQSLFLADQPLVEPHTPTQTNLAAIWREVLGRDNIGINQNFFEIGGHSLLAIKIVSRINTRLGLNFSIRHIFEKPTIAELAQLIEDQPQTSPTEQKPALKRVAREIQRRR